MSRKAIIALNDGSKTQGKVENIIEITAQAAIGFKLPQGRLLWDCGQYPVAIGDDWNDGVFSREGGELVPVPTAEQKIAELEDTTNGVILDMLADHEYRISLAEMGVTESDLKEV